MNENNDYGKCDVCGEPATHLARDSMMVDGADPSSIEYEPGDNIKRGCDKHPVHSETINCQTFRGPLGGNGGRS